MSHFDSTYSKMICVWIFVVAAGLVGAVEGYASISKEDTFQWQLTETLDKSVNAKVYDIDLFENSASTINSLKSSGKIVICYFSAGTYEDWRDDVQSLDDDYLGNQLEDWPDEKWWDVTEDSVRDIVSSRLDLAVSKGCDGVEPDNVDAYDNGGGGLDLSEEDLEDFLTWIAEEAHDRDLSIGLKNAVSLIPAVESHFDWALNEECFAHDECDTYEPFLDNDKAVFHTEYVDKTSKGSSMINTVCGNVPSGFTTIVKLWDLNAWRLTCP